MSVATTLGDPVAWYELHARKDEQDQEI